MAQQWLILAQQAEKNERVESAAIAAE